MRVRSSSPADTRAFAARVAARTKKTARRTHATAFALRGDLGSGKTTFTQAFLRAFGVRQRVTSPTFILMHRYRLKDRWFTNAYHVDGYRLKNVGDFRALGLHGIMKDPHAIILIEWPAKARTLLPRTAATISFEHGVRETERSITMAAART